MSNSAADELMDLLYKQGHSVGSAYGVVLSFVDKFFKSEGKPCILLSSNPAEISVRERISITLLGKPIPKYRAAQLLMGASQKLIQPKKKGVR